MAEGAKKTTRTRKTTPAPNPVAPVIDTNLLSAFAEVENQIATAKSAFEALQKEIFEARTDWEKEKIAHEQENAERNQQEEINRQHEQELYAYEANLKRKKAEDEFTAKKEAWERDLSAQKDTLTKERQELEALRKQVAGFEAEKAKAVKEAVTVLEKQLRSAFDIQNKLADQETKGREGMLNLRLETLEKDNLRLTEELATLKQALNRATEEVKDIAVKVIESRGQNVRVESPTPTTSK